MARGHSRQGALNDAANAAKPNGIGADLDFKADLSLATDKLRKHLGSSILLLANVVVKASRGRPNE